MKGLGTPTRYSSAANGGVLKRQGDNCAQERDECRGACAKYKAIFVRAKDSPLLFVVAIQLFIILRINLPDVDRGMKSSLGNFERVDRFGRALSAYFQPAGHDASSTDAHGPSQRLNSQKLTSPWKVTNWADPISTEDEFLFECEWSTFKSSSGKEVRFCGGPAAARCSNKDYFTQAIAHGNDDEKHFYVDIGSYHGACMLEVLLETNARILAFEPHPKNVYSIRKTISKLDPSLQHRVMLFPIGLADERQEDVIHYTPKTSSLQTSPSQLSVYAERFDSVFKGDHMPPEAKMFLNLEVQGFECKILRGMGGKLADKIEAIKLKWTDNGRRCDGGDYLPRLRDGFGLDLWRSYANGKHDVFLPRGEKPQFQGQDIYASRRDYIRKRARKSDATMVRPEISPRESGGASQNDSRDKEHLQKKAAQVAPGKTPETSRTKEGTDPKSWKIVNWDEPISAEDESMFDCDWSTFKSSNGDQVPICQSSAAKTVTCANGNYFVDVWYRRKGQDMPYYMEIGAEKGACILEMLLETDARIVAFEPHPENVYSIKKTMSKLDRETRGRVALVPIGLSDELTREEITLKSRNSPQQAFQVPIFAKRLDSMPGFFEMLPNAKALVNMDVQGFECQILDGMGEYMVDKIEVVKLKWNKEVSGNKCRDGKDFLDKLREKFGLQVRQKYSKGKYYQYLGRGMTPENDGVHLYVTM